jgi:alkylated DNA repair dioxygenase AlkB
MTGRLPHCAKTSSCSWLFLKIAVSIVATGLNAYADFCYVEDFLSASSASRLLQHFWQDLRWSQQDITLFGRRVPQPRLTCWYGDTGAHYSYSALHLEPLPWHPDLLELRWLLQEKLRCSFNSVLVNAYRDGRDSMGWHADDEKELGPAPCIASLSLGASRRFLLREKHGKNLRSIFLQLEHGSLLVMQHDSQCRFMHSLPKTRKPAGLRINLTFRQVFRP